MELLREALDSFGWYGIGIAEPEPTTAAAHEPGIDNAGHEEDEEEEYGPVYFDPADVQGAVDEAISTLIKEKLVPGYKNPKKPPTLGEVFAVLFGSESELAKQAEHFEELISGYEDRAHVDDLREAYNILEGIVDEIAPKVVGN